MRSRNGEEFRSGAHHGYLADEGFALGLEVRLLLHVSGVCWGEVGFAGWVQVETGGAFATRNWELETAGNGGVC